MADEIYKDNRNNHCGSSCTLNFWRWDLTPILKLQGKFSDKYAIVILNRPVTQHPNFLKRLWNKALIRVTVDGGTEQWERFLQQFPEDVKRKIKEPDLVTGDFDSIREETLNIYKKKSCKVLHTPDQHYTDFTKSLIEINIHSHALGTELDHVIAFSQCSGRIDQTLGNIQTLFLAKSKLLLNPNTDLYLISDDTVSWLLCTGEHYITVPPDSRTRKRVWCSLVPVGEPCKYVTTTGLKWNLDHQALQYGDLVSTSNAFDGSEMVTVNCSSPLLFSMKVPSIMEE